ncbi:MAG: GatB/YqeY domain-containing protein [Chloroflexota bacterium]
MVTKEDLEARLHSAMRSGDAVAKRSIRMVLSAWKLAEVERGGPLAEADALSLLQKEAKGRRETIADAERAGRKDLLEAAQAELAFIEAFLPQPLTAQELQGLAQVAIQEAGASGPEQMGMVMKVLMPKVQGRAGGKEVSQVVRNLLEPS